MTTGVQILRTLNLPLNQQTDGFGAFRDWAPAGETDPVTKRPGWEPSSSYRPIHYGVDFRAYPNIVTAPGDGFAVWDLDSHMITFVPSIHGLASFDIAIYLRHVIPVMRPWSQDMITRQWLRVQKDQPIADCYSGGTYAAHLHFELVVSLQTFADLTTLGVISGRPVGTYALEARADRCKIDRLATMQRIYGQMETDHIKMIGEDVILRDRLPGYKLTEQSELGVGPVAVVDPRKAVGHEA